MAQIKNAPTTFALPKLIGDPTSFVHLNMGGSENLFVSSNSGLHWMQLKTDGDLVYMREVMAGNCSDVVVVGDPSKARIPNSILPKLSLAALCKESMDPRNSTASIVFIDCGKLINEGVVEVIMRITIDRSWGRVLKMVFSAEMGRLYFSSRIDHQFGGKHQIACVWALSMAIPGITDSPTFSMAERLIRKKPGNIRHIAISDQRKVLATSDLNDNSVFTVDLYDLASDPPVHLRTVSQGSASGGWPIGSIYYPQGVSFDGVSRLYVVDETRRVQRFSLLQNRVDAVVAKAQFDLPKKAIAKGRKLFIIGCQYGRAKIPKGGYLSVIYDVM